MSSLRSPPSSSLGTPSLFSPTPSLPPFRGVSISGGPRALVGTFHLLRVSLINRTPAAMSLTLTVQPFHESVGGTRDEGASLQSKLLIVGGLSHRILVLGPGERVSHQVRVCFTAVGRFQFEFTARQTDAESGPPPTAQYAGEAAALLNPHHRSDPFHLLASIAAATVDSEDDADATDEHASSSVHSTPSRKISQAEYSASESEVDSEVEEDMPHSMPDDGAPHRRHSASSPMSDRSIDLVFRCKNILLVQAYLQ
jgi:hypothetical protein